MSPASQLGRELKSGELNKSFSRRKRGYLNLIDYHEIFSSTAQRELFMNELNF